MENQTKQSSNGDNANVVHQIERVNLYNFGYEKSGNVKGDPDIFSSFLNRIIDGDLVEENYKGLSNEEKTEKREQIKDLEQKQKEIEKGNEKTEIEIKKKEDSVDEYRQELLKIREVKNADHEKIKRETFSPFKFGINLFILVALSIYLFFFYVSTAYKALYVDFEKVADGIAQGLGTGGVMPGPYELAEALQYNYLLFLVPFVFYAFGWAFHVLLELKHKFRLVFVGLLVVVTFIVDFLLALLIHGNTEMAKELMGLETEKWSGSPTFYIILSLGFLVYILWSILFDSLLREWDKRKITINVKKIIKHLNNDLKILKSKIISTDDVKLQISNNREDINTVMFGNLKKYVDQFTSGWISYLSPDNMKAVKERCIGIKKDFEDKNNIKPGVVKVVSRRG
jgi:hypothetical protein